MMVRFCLFLISFAVLSDVMLYVSSANCFNSSQDGNITGNSNLEIIKAVKKLLPTVYTMNTALGSLGSKLNDVRSQMMQVMQYTFQADFRLNKMSVELNNMKRTYARKFDFEEGLMKLVTDIKNFKAGATEDNTETKEMIREFKKEIADFQRGVTQELRKFEIKIKSPRKNMFRQ
ncbi:UNVERIFIED_CONTAM: hypothetical protein RMT77_016623 [Armadillidium vulgare]